MVSFCGRISIAGHTRGYKQKHWRKHRDRFGDLFLSPFRRRRGERNDGIG
uniref:Uncharacterized protein n=1 Tax=Peronospora matthiolae TaxID=2874970 RepID=A0AAV1TPC3_9STRA